MNIIMTSKVWSSKDNNVQFLWSEVVGFEFLNLRSSYTKVGGVKILLKNGSLEVNLSNGGTELLSLLQHHFNSLK
jgi:hypothetical protein